MSGDTGLIAVSGQETNGSEHDPAARVQPPGGHPTPLDINAYLRALLDLLGLSKYDGAAQSRRRSGA